MCQTAAFTLTELLVVMAIIAVLLAAVIPAVGGLGNTPSRRGAVGSLLGVLDRARMMAISDGLATYVVFAVPGGDGQGLKPELMGHAYAIYQDHDNVTFTPEQRTPWIQLPRGMAFKVNSSQGIGNTVANRSLTSTDPLFLVNAGAMSNSSARSLRLPYWKFDGTGAVDEQDPYLLRLLMFPGVVDASGNEIATQRGNGTAANLNKMLLEEITINPATGRARYTVNPNNMTAPTPTPAS